MGRSFGDGTASGWQLGHEIARDRHPFPGEPLPDGHLGRPSDLAFWASVGGEDDDDPAEHGGEIDDWDDELD